MHLFLLIENLEQQLSWMSPADRWQSFLEPLINTLREEQLGKVLDIDKLVADSNHGKVVVGNELAMRVSDLPRTIQLIRRIEQQAATRMGISILPAALDITDPSA